MPSAATEQEPEVLGPETAPSLAPTGAGTLTELANRLDKGVEIIKARAEILQVARKAAISMTSPEDWIKFKDKEGREIAYLQDCGCDRIRDVYGIDIFNVSKPEKIQVNAEEFMYVITGSGRCRLTGQELEAVEGGRSSNDDFITLHKPPLKGYEIELQVRKAARANLDGQICRTLAGLQSVPRDEILAAWEGNTRKTWTTVRAGRGYGSGAERQGAKLESEWNGPSPNCPKCGSEMRYKPAGQTKAGKHFEAFFGCTKYPKCEGTMPKADWEEQLSSQAEDLPEDLRKIREKLSSAKKNQVTDVFQGLLGDLRGALGDPDGDDAYRRILADHGVQSFNQFTDVGKAWKCARDLYNEIHAGAHA